MLPFSSAGYFSVVKVPHGGEECWKKMDTLLPEMCSVYSVTQPPGNTMEGTCSVVWFAFCFLQLFFSLALSGQTRLLNNL